jgi:CheY-like chemotaxis protein
MPKPAPDDESGAVARLPGDISSGARHRVASEARPRGARARQRDAGRPAIAREVWHSPCPFPGRFMPGSSPNDAPEASVLVVEDDAAMRALLKDFLERAGFRVIEEESSERALTLVDSAVFDVAILDKEMPGVSGLEFLSHLRQRRPQTPVILITAFGGRSVAEEVFARGAARYLEKPFRISDLVAVIRALTHKEVP